MASEICPAFGRFSTTFKITIYARRAAMDSGLVEFPLEESKNIWDYLQNHYLGSYKSLPPKIGDFQRFPIDLLLSIGKIFQKI